MPTIEGIREALSDLRSRRVTLKASPYVWMHDAIRDIFGGNSKVWLELERVTDECISSVEAIIDIADGHNVELPDTVNVTQLREDAQRIGEHLESGGKLGWGPFRPKVVKERLLLVKKVRVNGRSCSTAEHYSVLATALQVRVELEKAWGFWLGRTQRTNGPYSLQLIELQSLRDALEKAFSLYELADKCRKLLLRYPAIKNPVWTDESQVERLVSSCRLAHALYSKRLSGEKLLRIEKLASSIAAREKRHPATEELLRAIQKRDVAGFAQAATKIEHLETERQQLQKVEAYLSKLQHYFPRLTDDLKHTCREPHWDERLENIEKTWSWAQARYWIKEYIRKDDVSALNKRAKQIDNEVNTTIAELASLHAWSFCFSRLKEDHRRHMEAWQQSMRRLGKGTGKHAPRHRREAQQHLDQCREAVPAWVMPLHRVWDTVDPAPGMFDVIIVDEASQCGVEALSLFYLGKKILIVGDDKQISPDAVGLPRASVQSLMDQYLQDFQFKSSFDVESSLFDHGKLRYGTRRITLREHFRCMPEIIRFSNDLCYSDTPLIPLRQYGPNRLVPLDHVLVENGYREGSDSRAINRPEAERIVEHIVKMCSDRHFDGKSVGVVVLQGDAQAALIESQLLERLGAEEMERRHLVCGNPYSFQGDERDIIFLSLVAATNERIGALTRAADERRFNVAASRARDQMILFHSVASNELSASCLRRRLLEFFEDTYTQQIAGIERSELEHRASQDNRRIVSPPPPFESWFEVDVALAILSKNYTVLAQHEVAGKRLDLVVEGGQSRLAVECDGDEWHGADRYEADMERQRQLERCGWEFFRVRESAFYANRTLALEHLWQALDERGILPRSSFVTKSPGISYEEPGPIENGDTIESRHLTDNPVTTPRKA